MANDKSKFTMNSVFVRCYATALILGLSGLSTLVNTQSTSGFSSIDCGYSNSSYVDNSTTVKWVNDGDYTITGTNGELNFSVNSTMDNFQALQTFRYFPEGQPKYCYDVPNQLSNGSFLLRAMFLHGNSSLLALPVVFNVYVGNTKWISVQYSSNDDIETLTTTKAFESIFYSAEKIVHLCLVPVTGVPFISSLELRPFVLNNDSFLYQTPYQYRWSVLRWNTGAGPGARSQRYPDDKFDRIWTLPDSVDSYIPDFTNPTKFNSYGTLTNVLRDAWLNDNPNSSFVPRPYSISYDGLQDRNLGEGIAYFYFWEISRNATSSTIRKLNVKVHNVSHPVNVTDTVLIEPMPISSLKQPLDFTVTTQPSSTLGPLLNGIALYALFDFDNSTTVATDAGALQSLQTSLDLPNEPGDPCLPVAWDWVNCAYNSSTFTSRVTKILLSGRNIKGTIPSSILQMDALTEIHLDNNSLSGPIPDGLVDLKFLTVLLLNTNNLSGEVPAGLLNNTRLYFTDFGNSLLTAPSPSSKKKSQNSVGVIVGATVGALIVLVTLGIFIVWLLFFRKPMKHKTKPLIGDIYGSSAGNVSLDKVVLATNNYAEKIGTGSYGSVYRGTLDGKAVAVKVNNIHSDQRNREFINEVDILTRVHHKNLVSLIGFCQEEQQLILIYEYQANGTLREWLRDSHTNITTPKKFLPWSKRLQIAVDAAKGLEYLHKDCIPSIIHRDVKSSNILLGDNLVGKVADFGISKTEMDKTQELSNGFFTTVKGTNGYLDPEYFDTSILTQKSDVYSFGVVLAELISGRPPFRDAGGGTYSILVDELRDFVKRADLQGVADPLLDGDYDEECMWRVADIALSCVQRSGDERPDMTEVARNLELIECRNKERAEETHSSMAASGLIDFSNNLR